MIPVAEPDLSANESTYVRNAISSGWVSANGPYVEEFEERIAKVSGRSWCVATVTGTAALHTALYAAGVHRGVSVSIPALTFIATANAVKFCGAEVQVRDIDTGFPDSCLLRSSFLTVADAAPSVGEPYHSKRGWMACLSFNGNKTITTGQGGAVVGDDLTLYRKVRKFVNVGRDKGYDFGEVGQNYGMSNLSAALGVAQLERLREFKAKKRQIIDNYEYNGFKMLPSSWMAVAVVDDRDALIRFLAKEGIEAKPFWKPIHLQPSYRDVKRTKLVKTEALWQKLVCLPCSVNLDQDRVLEVCERFVSPT